MLFDPAKPRSLSCPCSSVLKIFENSLWRTRPILTPEATYSFWRLSAKSRYDSFATTVSCAMLRSATLSPSWFTGNRSPRPIVCLRSVVPPISRNAQIWKLFGLSHPSLKAEWLKIKRTFSFSSNRRDLSRIIKSYASSLSLDESFVSTNSSGAPFLPLIEAK